jgi:uncharacterized protein involved in exopolysaccharide biosynthesis
MSSDNQQKTLFDAWDVLVRYRWRFVLPAFIALVLALGMSLLLPRKFQGEAMFERRLDMVLSEIMQRGGQRPAQDPRQSLVQELTGPPAIDQVVDRLAPQLEAAARKEGKSFDAGALKADLPRRLIVKFDIATPSVDRVRLTYSSDDPQLARTIVNGLINDYIDRTRADIDRQLRQSEEFFVNEVEQARSDIEDLENRKLSYEIDHAALLPDTTYSIQSMVQESQEQLGSLEQSLATVDQRIATLSASLATTPKTQPSVVMSRNPELVTAETKLKELNSTLNLYVGTYKMTDRHPDLVDLKSQIASLQEHIVDLPEQVVKEQHVESNAKRTELELKLTEATAERDSLKRQVEAGKVRLVDLNRQSENLFPVRAEYRKITRQVEQNQRQLAFWEDNLRRVRMALTAESGNRGVQLDFIKPCPVVSRPISPDPAQVLLAAIAICLTAGAASVFIAYRTNESFQSSEQLAGAFNMPLLGSVSEIISSQQRRARHLRRVVFYPLNAAVMTSVVMIMAGLVYLQLKQPAQFAKLTSNPLGYVSSELLGRGQGSSRD